MQKATLKEIQKERKRLSALLEKSAKVLSSVDYAEMNDKFSDTSIENDVADIESLRSVIFRIADSIARND